MPWESKTVEELRREFVLTAEKSSNFSAVCREFGITRKTGYKWLERYNSEQPLSDRSRAPNTVPNRTSKDMEQLILQVRFDNPGWGNRKVAETLRRADIPNVPCDKTVNNIFNRYGLISKEESLKRTPYNRFEKEHCNEMWQTDFKGDFPLSDGSRCFPLTILDDCSRFSIKIDPKPNTLGVTDSFKEAFYEFGTPISLLSDNGWTFRGLHGGYTHFEKWLMDHDVLPIHGRIKHPQTQGKIERFHRSMKSELLIHNQYENLEAACKGLQEWRIKYNEERPHEALGMKCPSEVYVPSNRRYIDKVEKYEYGGQYHVIKVNSWGYARYDKWQVYLSETMVNDYIEFRANPLGDSFFAYYRNFKIAEFSVDNGSLLNRKISRL
jgi:transposase InsO family protein